MYVKICIYVSIYASGQVLNVGYPMVFLIVIRVALWGSSDISDFVAIVGKTFALPAVSVCACVSCVCTYDFCMVAEPGSSQVSLSDVRGHHGRAKSCRTSLI